MQLELVSGNAHARIVYDSISGCIPPEMASCSVRVTANFAVFVLRRLQSQQHLCGEDALYLFGLEGQYGPGRAVGGEDLLTLDISSGRCWESSSTCLDEYTSLKRNLGEPSKGSPLVEKRSHMLEEQNPPKRD